MVGSGQRLPVRSNPAEFPPSRQCMSEQCLPRQHRCGGRRILALSVAEAQSRRRGDVVVHEKAVRQSAIEFRPKDADVNIPLRCKLPVDNTRDRVQRTGALRVLFAVAEHDPAGWRAKVGMLLVVVISGDHIHLVGDGVFDAGPIDIENPVSKTAGRKFVLTMFVLLNV